MSMLYDEILEIVWCFEQMAELGVFTMEEIIDVIAMQYSVTTEVVEMIIQETLDDQV